MVARRQVGELEAEVLSVLAGSAVPLSAGEVLVKLDGGLAYTTVATILGRLRSKELVARDGEGRAYKYRLAVDEADLIAGRMHSNLRHAHNLSGALGQFVNGLTNDEEATLRQAIVQLDDEQ